MKLKKWLREYEDMSYAEFKKLDEAEQYEIRMEHSSFCKREELRKRENVRPATEEEKKYFAECFEKERRRYERSLEIGGIDERGNYTALHHRWEE